jgi:hypothetical protein
MYVCQIVVVEIVVSMATWQDNIKMGGTGKGCRPTVWLSVAYDFGIL